MKQVLRVNVRKFAIPAAIAIFGVGYVLFIMGASSRRTQGFHGLFHSAYVYQIVNGIIPPTNPDSIGAPAGLYWGWHLLLAFLIILFGISSLEAILVVNSIAFSATLLCLWLLAGRITQRTLPRLAILGSPFFLLDPIRMTKGLILTAFRDTWLVNLLHPWLYSKTYLFFLKGWVDIRPAHFLYVFLNFAGLPLTVALTLLVYSMVLIPLPRKRGARYVLVGFTSFLIAFFHPISAMGAAALLFTVTLHKLVFSGRTEVQGRKLTWQTIAPPVLAIMGFLLALPYALSLSSTFRVGPHLRIPANGKELQYNGWAFLTTIPLLLYCIVRFKSLRADTQVATVAAGIFLALTIFTVLPDDNQYKFTYYFALVAAFLVVEILDRIMRFTGSVAAGFVRTAGKALVLLIVLVSFMPFLFVGWKYLTDPSVHDDPYIYAGRYARLRFGRGQEELRDRQSALDWIRENTLPTDYILTQPVSHNLNEIPLLTGRRTVANTPSVFTETIPYHEELVERTTGALDALGQCRGCEEEIGRLLELPAPWPQQFYALLESGRECPPSPSFSLVYANPTYKVYRINCPAKAPAAPESGVIRERP